MRARAGATVRLKSLSHFNAPEPEWKEGRREGRRVRVGWHYSHSFVVNAAQAIPGNGGKPFVRATTVRFYRIRSNVNLLLGSTITRS